MKALLVPITALTFAVSAPAAFAQGAPGQQDSAATSSVTRVDNAPRRRNAVAGIRAASEPRDHVVGATASTQQGAPTGQAKLLMVIGGAAFVGGLLVGDDAGTAIAVVGLGIGIYGLYLYMK